MAIPRSNETPRNLYLRTIVAETDIKEVLEWSLPSDEDFALFGRIIHIYSTMDFLLRFAAGLMDAQGLLSKPWHGKIAAQPIFVVSREVQWNQLWTDSHRRAFELMEEHRRV